MYALVHHIFPCYFSIDQSLPQFVDVQGTSNGLYHSVVWSVSCLGKGRVYIMIVDDVCYNFDLKDIIENIYNLTHLVPPFHGCLPLVTHYRLDLHFYLSGDDCFKFPRKCHMFFK